MVGTGAVGNPNWVAGHSSPGGRPKGSRNRRTESVLQLIEDRGDRDPIDIASEIANNTELPPEVRAPYTKLVADYKHSRMAATPALVFVTEPVELPNSEPKSIVAAINNIAYIDALFRAGALDLASHDAMIAGQDKIIDGFKALGLDDNNQSQVIEIRGGLPAEVCERMRRDGGPVFPAPANTGGPDGPVEACRLMRSQAR